MVKRKSCIRSLPLFVLFMVFFGCATIQFIPVTQEIILEVGGVDNTIGFQYHLSKEIILNGFFEDPIPTRRGEGGQMIRERNTERVQITISENLPGLVRSYSERADLDGELSLIVAFENPDDNTKPPLLIPFGRNNRGTDEKYYILFTDPQNHKIQYSGREYTVSYDGEPPYLLIEMQQISKNTSSKRNASGLRVGQ